MQVLLYFLFSKAWQLVWKTNAYFAMCRHIFVASDCQLLQLWLNNVAIRVNFVRNPCRNGQRQLQSLQLRSIIKQLCIIPTKFTLFSILCEFMNLVGCCRIEWIFSSYEIRSFFTSLFLFFFNCYRFTHNLERTYNNGDFWLPKDSVQNHCRFCRKYLQRTSEI